MKTTLGAGLLLLSLCAFSQDVIGSDEFNRAVTFYEQARLAFTDRLYDKAVELFDKAIALNPNNSDYFYGRGASHYELNALTEAIKDIEMAISLEPNQADYHQYAGNLYFHAQKYNEAIVNYSKALQYQGNGSVFIDELNAYYNRGVCHLLLKSYNKACEDFTRVIRENDKYGDAYYNLAVAYLNLGKKEQACSNFSLAYDLGIDKAEKHLNARCR